MGASDGSGAMGRRLLLLIFTAALAIRIGVAVVHPPADDGDQLLYRILAKGIASGTGYVDTWVDEPETTVHPLLPLLVAGALHVISDERLAGFVVTVLIGSLLAAVAAWFVGSSFGRAAGIATGAVLAVQPHHVLASARLEPDLLGALLGFGLAAALVRERWMWAGIAVGLAYLNRPESLVWLPAAGVFAWARGAGARAIVAMAIAAFLLASPFVVYVRAVEGRWALSGKDHWQYMLGVHQYRSGGQPLDPARVPELQREISSPLDHLAADPREFVLGYAYRTGILLRNLARQTGWGLLAPFAILGWIVARRRSRAAAWALVVPLATLPILPLVGTFFRHSQVPAAVLLALAAIGLAHGVEAVAARLRAA